MKKTIKQDRGIKWALGTLAAHFFVAAAILEEFRYSPEAPLAIYFGYVLVAMGLSYVLFRADRRAMEGNSHLFHRFRPLATYGYAVYEFEYLYHSGDPRVLAVVLARVVDDIRTKLSFGESEKVEITDIDKRLVNWDSKQFVVCTSDETVRGSQLHFILHASNVGDLYSLHWWLTVDGFIERGKILKFLCLAPLSLPTWIIPRLRAHYNIAQSLRTTYNAYYDAMDLTTRVRAANKVVVAAVIEVLEANGVDVSDLKQESAQILNIQISGGKTSFGNIVQGAMNKVATVASTKATAG